MGYTHYWYLNTEVSDDVYREKFKKLLPIVRKIIFLAGVDLESNINDRQIEFNGVGDDGCEPFEWFPDTAGLRKWHCDEENFPSYAAFGYCKTRQLEYDVVVVACLCAIEHIYGKKLVRISRDGNKTDGIWWKDGKILFKMALEK